MIDWKKVLLSPRVWAVLLTIVVVVLTSTVPAIAAKLDLVKVSGAVLALITFVIAMSASPVSVLVPELLGKPQFWVLIVQLAFIFVSAFVPNFPVKEDLILELIAALGAGSTGLSYRAVGESKLSV